MSEEKISSKNLDRYMGMLSKKLPPTIQSRYKDLPELTEDQKSAFWGNCDRRPGNECWLWSGILDGPGYGVFRIGRRRYRASRMSLYLATGRDGGALLALHKCDNPPCVNPKHLYWGNGRENTDDAVRRKRSYYSGMRGMSKINQPEAEEIRNTFAAKGTSMKELAANYKVSYSTIYSIIKGQTHKSTTTARAAGAK